jgi:hypothetical protein
MIKTTILLAITILSAITTLAETNTNHTPIILSPPTLSETNVGSVDYNKIDITFGGAGTSYNNHNTVGFDTSFSIDPFKQVPSIWVGASQSIYWQPLFGGATDIDADWNQQIWRNLYFNGGWSIGNVYGAGVSDLWRTGPEILLQWYFNDHTYSYAGANYDLFTQESGKSWRTSGSDNGVRWQAGIGLEF